jgi:hypothetical protein
MFRRAHLHQRRVLELVAINTLLAIILMTSMQTLIPIPHYAAAQLTPTSPPESGIRSITPATVSSPLGGQPIVPASSDAINNMVMDMADPLQNTSLSNITQQATIDSALAGHLPGPVPLNFSGCVSLCAAINDGPIENGGVVGGNGVFVSNGGNGGDGGDGSGGDGSNGNGGGDGDGSNGDGSGGGNGGGDGSNGDGSGGGNGGGDGSNGDGSGGDGSNGDGSGGDGSNGNGGGSGGGNGGGGNGGGGNGGGDGSNGNGGGGNGGGDGDGSNGGGSGGGNGGGDGDGSNGGGGSSS